jgi:F0F1-type ATP synthase assembly protein I
VLLLVAFQAHFGFSEAACQLAASVKNPSDDRSPIAKAYQWASRIMLASLEMVLPCLAGLWIDTKLGTVALFMVIGLAIGCSLGMWHLLRMLANERQSETSKKDSAE